MIDRSTGFTELDKLDIKSRLQFSVAAGAAIVHVNQAHPEVLLHMAANPQDLLPLLHGELAGQALHEDDFQRIVRIVKYHALNPGEMLTPEQMERL